MYCTLREILRCACGNHETDVHHRRPFLKTASALGASLAFTRAQPLPAAREWREQRDPYPEGVASGDPETESVLVWTRRPPVNGEAAKGYQGLQVFGLKVRRR